MGWWSYPESEDWRVGDLHEGFVQLVVREDESGHWLPVTSCAALDHGNVTIESDDLRLGAWSADRRVRVRQYRVQVACSCGWTSPLLPVPLDAVWSPCSSLDLDVRDEEAAVALWGRFHRDHVADWPASLTQSYWVVTS